MADIITPQNEDSWFASIMAFLQAFGVPIATWVGKRHPGLALAKYVARALGAFDGFAAELEDSIFLQSAIGKGLLKLARSQYQLEPFPAVAQLARFTVSTVAGSPASSVAVGDVTAGLSGGSLEWTNAEAFTVVSGGSAVVLFQAREQGSQYNVPSDTAIDLRTTIIGASIACPAVGAATDLGLGTSGLQLFAARAGVTVEVINPGPSSLLTVAGNAGSGLLTIRLGTDGGGSVTSTADDVRQALVTAVSATGVPALLAWARNISSGAGLMAVTTSPVALDWTGDYIEEAGSDVETPDSVKARCLTRFMGLGGWAGDGAPPAPASTDEGLEFWARQPPAGKTRSVVTGVRVLSNFLAGAPSGKDITVLVWKITGALSAGELAAVDANFYNGRKFSTGSDLHTVTVTNVTQGLTGDVSVVAAAGYTETEVRAAIAVRMTAYNQNPRAIYPGVLLQPSILAARIADSLPDEAISAVDLTVPPLPVTFAYNQWPVIDTSGLNINFV